MATSPLNFFFELGMLKRLRHQGAKLAGVEHPDSIAEHSMRAAMIAYVLAHAESGNPLRCAMMCIIHDIPECRVGDQHKVAARYVDTTHAEQHAWKEQMEHMPRAIQEDLDNLFSEFCDRSTKDGIIAKDADWVEMAISAREWVVRGYPAMQDWIDNIVRAVETPKAQEWLRELQNANPFVWWQGLKKMTYSKLK